MRLIFQGTLTPARMRAIRIMARWSVSDLSKETGLNRKYIQAIEEGFTDPPREHVELLLHSMDVTAEDTRMGYSAFEMRPFHIKNFP